MVVYGFFIQFCYTVFYIICNYNYSIVLSGSKQCATNYNPSFTKSQKEIISQTD